MIEYNLIVTATELKHLLPLLGGVPKVPGEVLDPRRQAPQGGVAGRPPGDRKDAAGARGRGRGGRALLPRGRPRVRRDTGGAGRAAGAGSLQ